MAGKHLNIELYKHTTFLLASAHSFKPLEWNGGVECAFLLALDVLQIGLGLNSRHMPGLQNLPQEM